MNANEQAERLLAAVDAAAQELEGSGLEGRGFTMHAPVEVLFEVAAMCGAIVDDLGITATGRRVFEVRLERGVRVSLLGARYDQTSEVSA